MNSERIRALEQRIAELNVALAEARARAPQSEVPDYRLRTVEGEIALSQLFGEHDHLLVIHNMGEGCRYCTLWADGFDGLLPHLESVLSVVLVSGDPPEAQRRFARSRGWHFRMASHAGSA